LFFRRKRVLLFIIIIYHIVWCFNVVVILMWGKTKIKFSCKSAHIERYDILNHIEFSWNFHFEIYKSGLKSIFQIEIIKFKLVTEHQSRGRPFDLPFPRCLFLFCSSCVSVCPSLDQKHTSEHLP
jgi:hypothetical protein